MKARAGGEGWSSLEHTRQYRDQTTLFSCFWDPSSRDEVWGGKESAVPLGDRTRTLGRIQAGEQSPWEGGVRCIIQWKQ